MGTGILGTRHSLEGHSKALNVALWTVQVLLAGMFFMAGSAKSFRPIAELMLTMPWTADVPVSLIRFIGTAELLGAIGLLLPAITRIMPELTGWAAVGLLVDMLLATGFHVMRGETQTAMIPLCLAILAAFVGWGRLGPEPILPKEG
jgi:hypothetical protein